MTRVKRSELKIDHVYRVVGTPMTNGRSVGERQQFEALRYVGAMIPYRDGFADADPPVEVFYSYAKRQHFLFRPETIQTEELLD
jgi:hypothetical protein